MLEWLKQFLCKHKNTTKLREIFEEDFKDAFEASNVGGVTRHYGFDILKCDNCKKEIKRTNGKQELR